MIIIIIIVNLKWYFSYVRRKLSIYNKKKSSAFFSLLLWSLYFIFITLSTGDITQVYRAVVNPPKTGQKYYLIEPFLANQPNTLKLMAKAKNNNLAIIIIKSIIFLSLLFFDKKMKKNPGRMENKRRARCERGGAAYRVIIPR